MRVSLVLIILFITTLQLLIASPVRSQDMTVQRVTVVLEQESLSSAFSQIEEQTTLRFFYRKSEINGLNKLNLPMSSRTIQQTLFELLKNTGFSFRQVDQNILIQAVHASTDNQRRIEGIVLTADSGRSVKFAMVEVLRKSDLFLVGQANTDSAGHFIITVTDHSPHIIRVTLLGYRLYRSDIKDAENIVLSAIRLKPEVKVLQEVIVAARSPLIKQEVDRLSYNVQADPENKINNLLDMLRKVPLVSVDADDNVKLKGSSSFKVLIDGHTSSLVVNDPKEIFRSMAASSIQSIEVITVPPAKYDSEGLAGIINIITVKKLINGYSGNLGVSYKFPNGPRSYGSFNIKSGKISLSAYGGWNEWNIPHTAFSNDRVSNYPSPSTTNQNGSAQTKSNQGYLSTQVSYEIDSLNLIAAILGYNAANVHRVGTVYTSQLDSIGHSYNLDNEGRNRQRGYDLGLDYQHGFINNKTQLLSFSYRSSSNTSDQLNLLTANGQVNYTIHSYDQNNHSGTHENTFQLDYLQPVKWVTIEGGVKTIFRNNFSNYTMQVQAPSGMDFLQDPENSGAFRYDQNIYSIYNSYTINLKTWTLKEGLRLEKTEIQADFSNAGKLNIPGYHNLVPSIAIQKKLSPSTNINFGYTDRIQRPGIMQLNPYVDQQNPAFITYGNPDLKPEVNHVITLNYSVFSKIDINAGLSYSFSDNTIQYISNLGKDGITRSTYQNIGTNDNLEADLNINCPIGSRINFSLNAQGSYVKLKGIADSSFYSRKAAIGNGNIYLSYRFDNNWRAGLNFQYYSLAITLQSTSSPYYYSSISFSKSIFKKKLTISGSISNPYLKYLDYKYIYHDPKFIQTTHNNIVYRRFNIGISYSFGKLKDGNVKKVKKIVQNDDIKVIPSTLPAN